MALSTGRFNVARGQNRLLPRQRAAVGLLDYCRGALSAVAHHAAKLINGVRDHGMTAEGLGADVHETRFLQSNMARRAAIHHSELRKPDLLNAVLEMALQSDGLAAAANQGQVLFLIMTPLAEMVLGGSNGQRNQQQQADHAKGVNGITEQRLPQG